MSLELIRETVRINQLIGKDSTQTVVENDIIVPDVKPDIARILLLDGDVLVNSTETMQDRVVVNGTIRYKILYVSDEAEQNVKSINASTNFSYPLELINTRSGMRGESICDIEHINYEILNGRKINVRTIMKIKSKVNDEIEQDIVNGLAGDDDIQVLKNRISVSSYLGSNTVNCSVNEKLEIPTTKSAIREILRTDAKISAKEYRITDNKVFTKGELNISTLYVGEDESDIIQFMEHEIPFAQFVDLQGVGENSICDIDYQITDMRFEVIEDNDGELRIIEAGADVSISINGYDKKNIDVVEDAYSLRTGIDIEKSLFMTEELVADNKSQIILKDILVVEEGIPEILEVFNVLSKPCISDCIVEDDRIILEGVVSNNVLYLANSNEQPVFCLRQEIPFKNIIELKGIRPEMNCDVDLDIEHCNYSMLSTKEVEVRMVVGANAKVLSQKTIPVISKGNEFEIDESRRLSQASITIYYCQPEDTLWNIAKKYHTTVENISGFNNLDQHVQVNLGQQIMIPKNI